MSTIHSRYTKKFITAGSFIGLQRLMDKINHKYDAEHIYNEGVFLNAKGKETHWAWYKPTDKQILEEVSEVLNDN